MKKYVLFFLVFVSLTIFSQRVVNKDYELFLLDIEESELNISEGMYLSKNNQFYYQGHIEVMYLTDGSIVNYYFSFTTWDKQYKEFLVKDKDLQSFGPKITFKDKEFALIKKEGETLSTPLFDNSNLENSILSSMIVWLDNMK